MSIVQVGRVAFNQTTNNLLIVDGKIFQSIGAGPGPGPGSGGGSFTKSLCLVNKTTFVRQTCKFLKLRS